MEVRQNICFFWTFIISRVKASNLSECSSSVFLIGSSFWSSFLSRTSSIFFNDKSAMGVHYLFVCIDCQEAEIEVKNIGVKLNSTDRV